MSRWKGPPRPPWWNDDWQRPFPPSPPAAWRRPGGWHSNGERMFVRFAFLFGLLALLACGFVAMLAAAAALLFFGPRLPPELWPRTLHPARPGVFILVLVVAALMMAIVFGRVRRAVARRYTSPLGDTMRAADAVASGDLSARVPVRGSPEFRHLAQSFNRMAAALEIADRQRREFLADVAHELRTPLTIIQGNLEGLHDGIYEPTPEHLAVVLDETYKLGRLVEDLRLLTLADAGQLPLDVQALDAAQLLADVREAFALPAGEAGVELAVEAAPGLPPLPADGQRLGQVLGNLVANALRHTPPGGRVVLGAGLEPGGQAIRLSVADTGEGIAAEDLARIFDRFWRRDPARAHDRGAGSGLGLAIAKSLVEAHGGQIGAESEPGAGTVVYCVLPLAR